MSAATPTPPAPEGRPSTPGQAWQALAEGNERFAAGLRSTGGGPAEVAARRAQLAQGQAPFALVLGCSDSRVPAELVFDTDLGDLFVVRTAGQAVDSAVLGSVEFGVAVLGVPLVVVLGHEGCGAVAAAVAALDEGTVPGGWVRDLVERVAPSALVARRGGAAGSGAAGAARGTGDVVAEHVRQTAALLTERSGALAAAVARGDCAVVGAVYGLASGRVERLGAGPAPAA